MEDKEKENSVEKTDEKTPNENYDDFYVRY